MQQVELYSDKRARYRKANEGEARQLLEAIDGCYAPTPFSEETLSSALSQYRGWKFVACDRSTTVAEWITQLSAPALESDFKSRLAYISSKPKAHWYRAVFERFHLARFCEFRAALIATRSEHVAQALVAAPNSLADTLKADITLQPTSSTNAIPLQVKAVTGKSKRQIENNSPALLQHVWKAPLEQLLRDIERIITVRSASAGIGAAPCLDYK